jgi:DNA invertase Pin-like site-specific DNA recombinase
VHPGRAVHHRRALTLVGLAGSVTVGYMSSSVVAEFERSLISERRRVGQVVTKSAGNRMGRPVVDLAPVQLREAQKTRRRNPPTTWEHIAAALGLPASTIRRRYAEASRAEEAT